MFFLACGRSLPSGYIPGCRILGLSAVNTASSHRLDTIRGTSQRTLSTAFPIFHAAAVRSKEDRYQSLTVHYNSSCQIARASIACPLDRFGVSSAVDANLFVAPAICSRQSTFAEEISVTSSYRAEQRDIISR